MVSLPGLCLCIIIGIAPLFWLPVLPSFTAIYAIMFAAVLASCRSLRVWRYVALLLWSLCWGLLAAKQSLWPIEFLADKTLTAEVKITASDNGRVNTLRILRINGRHLLPAPGVNVYDAALPQPACMGQRWQMTLKLSAVHGRLNEGGFDAQRYALAQQLPLRGRIISAVPLDLRCGWRAQFIRRISAQMHDLPWKGVLLALGFGERAGLSAPDKQLLQTTGTAHLMAISGLHIGLSGTLGWGLVRLMQRLLPARHINWRLPLYGGLLMATLYTWLAGAQAPAVRTLLTMWICAGLRLKGGHMSGWHLWLICVAAMAFADPLVMLSDSFLLSVSAVAGLLFWYQWLPLRLSSRSALLRHGLGLAHLQLGMMLLLLPIQLAMFHGISLSNWPANMLAVPVVTFITVPLILLAMMLTLLPGVSHWLLTFADLTLEGVFTYLRWLPDSWLALDGRYFWLMFVPWGGLIVMRFCTWRVWQGTILALSVIALYPFWRDKPAQEWFVHMLDVGHGLAIVVERNHHAVLYDSGNAWQGGDSGQLIITPWLRWHHLIPDRLILSHEHLDHRGGLESLRAAWPGMRIQSSLNEIGHFPCWQGMRWRWQGLYFSVHWPPRGWRGKGNNRSCVVKIDDGYHRILLTGDLESAGEQTMVRSQKEALQADVLQVPHHGSRTSSTLSLLKQVSPDIAVASVARYNAWRLPSVAVVQRYRERDIHWYDTARYGQITLRFGAGKPAVTGFREHILPRWYHQWFGVTPVNR